jgi:acyl transferase domain-containing protein
VAFLLSGQGPESLVLATDLYGSHPVFRAAFDRAAALADPNLERPLAQVLGPDPGDGAKAAVALGQTAIAEPALFVVGYALSELWASWGVRPDLLLGQGAGEVLAAHLAGVVDLADALRLITARGQLLQSLPPEGAMAPLLEAFRQAVGPLKLSRPTRPLISSLSGDLVGAEIAEPGYWCDQVLGQVRLAKGLGTLRAQGAQVFVDLGAQPSLLNLAKQTLLPPSPPSPNPGSQTLGSPSGPSQAEPQQTQPPAGSLGPAGLDQEPLFLASLIAEQDPWGVILTSLARLHLRGLPIDWRGFHGPFAQRRVALPGYPFERQRHWWPSGRGPLPGAHRWLDHLGLAHQDQAQGEAPLPSPSSLEPPPWKAAGLVAPGPSSPSIPHSTKGFAAASLAEPGGSSQGDAVLPDGMPRATPPGETLQAHGLAAAGLAAPGLAAPGFDSTALAPTSAGEGGPAATPSRSPNGLIYPRAGSTTR